MVIVNRKIVPKGYAGITIWPFIFAVDEDIAKDEEFLNHERIHLKQQIELLVIPFYVWYILEYILRLFQYGNHDTAYRNISFEREAYFNQNNSVYLQERKPYNFLKFL